MSCETAIRRARLLAARRTIDTAIVAARLNREDGCALRISGLDRLREDLDAALDLVQDRPDRMMSLGRARAQTRVRVASANTRG